MDQKQKYFLKFPCFKYEYGLIINISNVVFNFFKFNFVLFKIIFFSSRILTKELNFTCETPDFRGKKTLIHRNINIIFMQNFETKTIGNYKLIKSLITTTQNQNTQQIFINIRRYLYIIFASIR